MKVAVEESFLIRWRFHLLLFFVFCAFALLVARVAYIQIIEPDNLIKQGDLRSVRVKSIPSARGIISDRMVSRSLSACLLRPFGRIPRRYLKKMP